MSTLTDPQRDKLMEEERLYIAMLNEKYGEPQEGWLVMYRQYDKRNLGTKLL